MLETKRKVDDHQIHINYITQTQIYNYKVDSQMTVEDTAGRSTYLFLDAFSDSRKFGKANGESIYTVHAVILISSNQSKHLVSILHRCIQ
jgi:hypothetical protein